MTDQQIYEFAQRVQTLCDAAKLTGGCRIEVHHGRRYVKIVKKWGGQTMVWGFVEQATGDILMAEGWKKPAKHARGSLHAQNMDIDKMKWTGPPYLSELKKGAPCSTHP